MAIAAPQLVERHTTFYERVQKTVAARRKLEPGAYSLKDVMALVQALRRLTLELNVIDVSICADRTDTGGNLEPVSKSVLCRSNEGLAGCRLVFSEGARRNASRSAKSGGNPLRSACDRCKYQRKQSQFTSNCEFQVGLPAIVRECLVGFSHAVRVFLLLDRVAFAL